MKNIYEKINKKEAAANKKILDKLENKLIELQNREQDLIGEYLKSKDDIAKQLNLSEYWDKLMLEIKKINRRITLFKNQC